MSEKIATPIIQPRIYFFKDSKPLVGGKVYAFKIGENEFKPTFRNAELTALNQNPIVLDQAGSCLIYMKGAVRLQVFDKNDVFIEERVVYQQRQIAQFFDKYGEALSFGKVHTLDYQSTIKKASYKNSDLNQNPILLDENGCAEISIAGAYRLRSYNKSGVFITDQDFKRLPARALTSRPYPAYFVDSIASTCINFNASIKNNIGFLDERVFAKAQILGVSIQSSISEISTSYENLKCSTSLISATVRTSFTSFSCDTENIATLLHFKNPVRRVALVINSMQVEAINASPRIVSAQIIN